MKIADVVSVAEFRESIRTAIPQIITLLGSWESVGANALAILSEQGKMSKILT